MDREFKILIVEDEPDFSGSLIRLIKGIGNTIGITLAGSRDEALKVLSTEAAFFDLVSLDLNLPAVKGGVETAPEYGLEVLGVCRDLNPGTPVLILTGSSTVGMLSEFLAQSHNIDVWAEGVKKPTIDHLPKGEIDCFIGRFTPIYEAVTSLSEVELSMSRDLVLPLKHDRLLRIFTKDRGGVRADVKIIGGGLSDASVYLVSVYGADGNLLYSSVAKCGCLSDIQEDSDNYDNMISRLPPEVTPRKLKVLEFGAKDISGVFYGLAYGFDLSFFKAAFSGKLTDQTFEYIQGMTRLWVDACVEKRSSVADVRRSLVADDEAMELIAEYELTWANSFESQQFQSKEGCIHGDLHGENILVDIDNEKATLIDYGDVSISSCAIDPVTLECSFLFHPDGLDDNGWPTVEQVRSWYDLDKYVEGSPVEKEIRFCRRWSDLLKAGNRELAACLYSYALRQLKYNGTNKDLALGLLDAARGLYHDS